MAHTKTSIFALGAYAALAAISVSAAHLKLGTSSVVLRAGQTVEIPVISDIPIASDLAARGAFEAGDVTFTDGPGCRRSAHGCTLRISASPNSKNYRAVSVVVSASRASKTVLLLSVIGSGEYAPTDTKLAETASEVRVEEPAPAAVTPVAAIGSEPQIQRSGNSLFFAEAIPHPGPNPSARSVGQFTTATNGPSYQIVSLRNLDRPQSLSISLTGSGADQFSIIETPAHYGANRSCASMSRISSGDTCILIVKGKIGDPSKAPETATLTLRGDNRNAASFDLRSTTYVYVAGGFDTLGNASVAGGSLLAQCTAGSCSNALQGTTGDNYATTNFSVGQWINALAVTPTGNLMVGGVFGAIGGATSGASSGTAALLAQCTPGAVVGNACINQTNTGATTNAYAFNNGYINGITSPFAISSSDFMVVAGDFSNIRNFSAAGGNKMIAKCLYNGTASSATCNNFMTTGGASSTKNANNTIVAVDVSPDTSSANPRVNFGGLFTQIGGYPSSAPSSGTTFASCTSNGNTCSQGMGTNNPNGSILGITNDGTSLYMGGSFTQIGGYTDSSGGYPLVSCTAGTPTTCTNALSGSNDANGYIEGLAYAGGNLYVGGKFTTIGGATPVGSGYMLAECAAGGACSNFVTDTNPYATGSDWGGVISAIAVGSQTLITAR